MKTIAYFLTSVIIFSTVFVFGQKDYPEVDVDYSSSISSYEEDGQTVYTFLLENTSNETIAFYDFLLKDESDDYYITEDLCKDALVLKPYEKATFFKCKGSTHPGATWMHKFLRYDDEYSSNPVIDKDYLFHYKTEVDGDYTTYSYHLKNISDQQIIFSNFSLDDDVDFFTSKDVPEYDVTTEPGEDLLAVKFMMSSENKAPSLTWNADWVGAEETNLGNPDLVVKNYDFCSGVMALLESSKNGFEELLGAKSEDSWLFDEYTSGVHLEGANNEFIEDLWVFFDYSAYIGYSDSEKSIENRFYEYKQKLNSCLPSELEATMIEPEEEDSFILKVTFSGNWKGDTHDVTLKIIEDYSNENLYNLNLTIDGLIMDY